MKALMYLKTKEGKYLFKGDSFWSKGTDPDYAKVYSNDDIDQINSWLKNGLLPSNIYKNKFDMVFDRYNDGVLGYFVPDESKFSGPYNIKKGTTIEELGKPINLWVVKLHPQSEWDLTTFNENIDDDKSSYDIDTKTMGYFENYTEYHRDKTINEILD